MAITSQQPQHSQDYINLVQRQLPQHLHTVALGYILDINVLQDEPDLIVLVLESRAIDAAKDKQNWFNLMPLMNTEQKQKLREILEKEKRKLKEIEAKYEAKKLEIKRKYLAKWQQLGAVKKVQDIRDEEAKQRETEEANAESLLHDL